MFDINLFAERAFFATAWLFEAKHIGSPWRPGMAVRVYEPTGRPGKMRLSTARSRIYHLTDTTIFVVVEDADLEPETGQIYHPTDKDVQIDFSDDLTVGAFWRVARDAWRSMGFTLKLRQPLVTVREEPWGFSVYNPLGDEVMNQQASSELEVVIRALEEAAAHCWSKKGDT